jgi:hypothetical protein
MSNNRPTLRKLRILSGISIYNNNKGHSLIIPVVDRDLRLGAMDIKTITLSNSDKHIRML